MFHLTDLSAGMCLVALLPFVCHCSSSAHQLYQTSHATATGQFDCLPYVNVWEKGGGLLETNTDIESGYFCRQAKSDSTEHTVLRDSPTVVSGLRFTFERLRAMLVTADDLVQWFAPIDMIEDYQSGEIIGEFYNCSATRDLWFGTRCEYTTNSTDNFFNFAFRQLYDKQHIGIDVLTITNGSCYEIGGDPCISILCLDWREICDGKKTTPFDFFAVPVREEIISDRSFYFVKLESHLLAMNRYLVAIDCELIVQHLFLGKSDCTNGMDELHCHHLEANECDAETEYRCKNGLCIDKVFYYDGHFDCTDFSDEKSTYNPYCYNTLDLICEESTCPSTWFSCGDGYCYDGPTASRFYVSCESQRDQLYLMQMPPSTLILFSHIMFNYTDTQPNRICFNENICPFLTDNYEGPRIVAANGLTCRSFDTFTDEKYVDFYDMVRKVKQLVSSCSVLPNPALNGNCSLFQCDDGSKCISPHRILDGHRDCSKNEDEYHPDTCTRNLPYRFACDNGSQCIHQALIADGTVSIVSSYIISSMLEKESSHSLFLVGPL